MKTIKYECLNHPVFFGERYVRHVINEFVEQYSAGRLHQGIGGGQLVKSRAATANDNGTAGPILCRWKYRSAL